MSNEGVANGTKPTTIQKPKNVIVVGMPRSGTSLSASIFAGKNYFITPEQQDELKPALRTGDEGNPLGYWEAESLIEHNVEILNRAGFPFHNTWLYEPIQPEQVANVNALEASAEHRAYVDTYNQHSPWVWKDPRLCYTLVYWWPMMNPLTTSVLFLRRNPEAIYQSFRRLNWRNSSAEDKKDVFLRIDNHLKAAEQAIKRFNIPHIEIDYQEYISAPDSTSKRIAEFFAIELGASELNVRTELNHNSPRGRVATDIASLMRRLSPRFLKIVKKFIPLKIIYAFYPEKKLARKE